MIVYAYAQGEMEHRVATLEKQAIELREDWNRARDRIERAINKAVQNGAQTK